MPLLVASLIRTLIQAATTTGLFVVIEKIIGPVIDAAKNALAQARGMTEEEAEDTIANDLIDAFAMIGILGVAIRTKLPNIAAEKLGFTTKGYRKRPPKVKTLTAPAVGTAAAPAPKPTPLSFGKVTTGIIGGVLAWNLLTDWVWIGNSLSFLPSGAVNDIQKRALSIKGLMDAPRTLVYSAEKMRRSITQQERTLIKQAADEAEKQIKDLESAYGSKFVLYNRQDVANQAKASTGALLIELDILRQMAGLIPRKPIQTTSTEAIVTTVIGGDTIKLDNGETIRMVGIDAPESTTREGEKAKKYLKERLTGKKVIVESDPDALIDIYGRRLGVVYLDE